MDNSTTNMRFVFENGTYIQVPQEQVAPITYPILFSYPRDTNPYRNRGWIPLIFSLMNILIAYACISGLNTLTDPASLIFCWVFLLMIVIAFIVTVMNQLRSRKILVDKETIQILYKFLRHKNVQINLDECIGYLPYTKQVNTSASRYTRIYSTVEGVILGFKNKKVLKISILYSASNPMDEAGRIIALKQLLDSKNIKDFTDSTYPQFKSFSNIVRIARRKFMRG